MKWSKLKKHAEEFLADSLQGRIQYHKTNYKMSAGHYDMRGRGWITLDKAEICNFSEIESENAKGKLVLELREISGATDYKNPTQREDYYLAHAQADAIVMKHGPYSQGHFTWALFRYINLPFDEVLASEDPIIRALGMFDRRLGKRRLRELEHIEDNFELVRQFYKIRCEAENIIDSKK